MTEPSSATTPPEGAIEPDAAGRRRYRWIHAVTDRVPTGWFAGILTAAFLGVTAAFGGLSAVAAPPVAQLRAGDAHENDQFAITIERAVLIDDLAEAGITVEPGERVLAVILTAENVWTRALPSTGTSGVQAAVRARSIGEDGAAASVARLDDAVGSPWLQPRVPAELVLTWAVADDALAGGDEITLDLRDLTLREGALVIDGEYWDSPITAAHLTVEVRDVGSGVTDETAGER
ncbi:hypothetical protein [Microbacterium sp. AG1240]|uniref:hypothetical protein n=1 Tax=Microbacterium sp. AG1240 TaxID=2183992 RepID=UPI0011C41A3F|nr:hypothetical protein [Microbacterium sp. AG1240]